MKKTIYRVHTPSGVIADGQWNSREEIPERIPDRWEVYFRPEEDGDIFTETIDVPNPPMSVTINYTNWKGVTADRLIHPVKVFWGSTEYHSEDQWLLSAIDLEKNAVRTFAMNGIHSWS